MWNISFLEDVKECVIVLMSVLYIRCNFTHCFAKMLSSIKSWKCPDFLNYEESMSIYNQINLHASKWKEQKIRNEVSKFRFFFLCSPSYLLSVPHKYNFFKKLALRTFTVIQVIATCF